MATTVRCPNGHVWRPDEFDGGAGALDPTASLPCPYCGTLCTESAGPLPPTKFAEHRAPKPVGEPPQTEFPGYEVLGVLGRGGMGVVYKARQIRTDRLVALKVPGHLDLETRVRFTAEAQAAARLSHPNIIQVYEVGDHNGRPFLALEYVDGGTLAAKLTGTPFPPRPAAALVETLAGAVGAAHVHGVVHRDLKPANVLLSSKFQVPRSKFESNLEPGTWNLELKVADFGLARRIDMDSGQTRSGMILGTPDYMAPEQAAGRNKEVGPPADVYALGAILYELLTGRPPFKGVGMLETLEQVRSMDPVAPRRLQPAIPRDLETICVKCLQKDAARRYSAAGELADDLRRFLDGQPVRARPVSRIERLLKRARRNPLAAGLTAGLCAVLIAAAAYGIWYHIQLQAQRDRARYHFQMSVRSIEELLTTEVADDSLDLEPRAELKRKALLEKALAFYEELVRVESDDPELTWLAARGAVRVGDIHRLVGRLPEAVGAYERAIERLTPLAARPPDGTDPVREIAYCHNFIGEIHRHQGDPAAAATAYRRALNIQQPLYDANPGNAGYRQDLSRTHYNLGIVALRTGHPDDAVAEFGEATRMLDTLPADDVIEHRHRARIHVNLAPALRAAGRLDEAARACRSAIELFDALIGEYPFRYDFQYEREAAVINLGLIHLSAHDPAAARTELTRAADRLAVLVEKFPFTRQYRAELARAHNSLAVVAFATDQSDDAAAMSARAADEWAALVALHNTPDYHGELGISLGNQGRAMYQSNPMAAKDLLIRGLAEVLEGLKGNPNDPAFAEALQKQTRVLAGLLVWARDHDRARALANQIAGSLPNRVQATHRAVALLAACLAAAERQMSPAAECDAYEALAIQLVEHVRPSDWSAVRADPDCATLRARPAFAKALGQ